MSSGGKLTSAKKAIRKLIKHLSEQDALSLVLYDTDVSTAFSVMPGDLNDDKKDSCTQQVREVASGSMTNLMGGIEEAARILTKLPGPSSAKRIFLFSDGLVNQGVTDTKKILSRVGELATLGITTCSFGIGRDFDQKLMSGIAEYGNSQYFYLESPQVIPKLVSKSVHGLISLVGTQAKLTLRGLGGSLVTRIFGSEDSHDLIHGFDLDYLHADNTRQVLVGMDVAPSEDKMASVLSYNLEFTDMNGVQRQVCGTADMSFVSDPTLLGPEDDQVRCAYLIQSSTDLDEQVAELLNQGKHSAAVALKQESVDKMQDAFSELNDEHCKYRLSKVLQRTHQTLEHMQTRDDTYEMQLELAYESKLQRRLSDACMDLHRECDSDDGRWSDQEEDCAKGTPMPSSDDDDEFY